MSKIYLQQFIAQNTQFSRREAEKLIKQGQIKINNLIAVSGQKVDPEKVIIKMQQKMPKCSTWNILQPRSDFVYYIVNKPIGYICTTADPFAEKKITDLVPKKPKVYPVGRLDKNSEGLIFLTNDGDFTYKITHPKFNLEKEYVIIARQIVPQKVQNLQKQLLRGAKLTDGLAKTDKVYNINKISPNTIQLNITIHAGKKRVIRRLFQALGWRVCKLTRIRIGSAKLDVATGKYRKLTQKEIKTLIAKGDN